MVNVCIIFKVSNNASPKKSSVLIRVRLVRNINTRGVDVPNDDKMLVANTVHDIHST